MENIEKMIIQKCEDHKIRLTPNEYKQLVIDYEKKYIQNIDLNILTQLADNIIRRNK